MDCGYCFIEAYDDDGELCVTHNERSHYEDFVSLCTTCYFSICERCKALVNAVKARDNQLIPYSAK